MIILLIIILVFIAVSIYFRSPKVKGEISEQYLLRKINKKVYFPMEERLYQTFIFQSLPEILLKLILFTSQEKVYLFLKIKIMPDIFLVMKKAKIGQLHCTPVNHILGKI